ncbi:1516_t:CDS:2, partial [Gigaspora rosea]
SRTLHSWYIHPISYEICIKELFDKLVTDEILLVCNIPISPFEIIEHIELSQGQKYLPTILKFKQLNRKQTLYNDIIEWICQNGRGWSSVEDANTQGKRFVNCLCETIWYIDMHGHLKLKECSYHIPELFLAFFGCANPESYKESRK